MKTTKANLVQCYINVIKQYKSKNYTLKLKRGVFGESFLGSHIGNEKLKFTFNNESIDELVVVDEFIMFKVFISHRVYQARLHLNDIDSIKSAKDRLVFSGDASQLSTFEEQCTIGFDKLINIINEG